MAKVPVPVTIDDLECTAKDAKDGHAFYKIRGEILQVYWDDATNNFSYQWGLNRVPRDQATHVLTGVDI